MEEDLPLGEGVGHEGWALFATSLGWQDTVDQVKAFKQD